MVILGVFLVALVLVGVRAFVRDLRAVVSDDMRDAQERREWARLRRIAASADVRTRAGRNRRERALAGMERIKRHRAWGSDEGIR